MVDQQIPAPFSVILPAIAVGLLVTGFARLLLPLTGSTADPVLVGVWAAVAFAAAAYVGAWVVQGDDPTHLRESPEVQLASSRVGVDVVVFVEEYQFGKMSRQSARELDRALLDGSYRVRRIGWRTYELAVRVSSGEISSIRHVTPPLGKLALWEEGSLRRGHD